MRRITTGRRGRYGLRLIGKSEEIKNIEITIEENKQKVSRLSKEADILRQLSKDSSTKLQTISSEFKASFDRLMLLKSRRSIYGTCQCYLKLVQATFNPQYVTIPNVIVGNDIKSALVNQHVYSLIHHSDSKGNTLLHTMGLTVPIRLQMP